MTAAHTLSVEPIGGGEAYVGHGDHCVLLCFTQEVGWWKNGIMLAPDTARELARILTQQADASEVPYVA